ncbi:hypothetical protein [Flammeovirga sp. SJP92]|uniref:hypothetical protein n=1 Tax=Flammeovirga sp. SJP92 TaxID=1775430 RepID=UPI0007883D98|nr:hypothetical protein [Flammeovirga sp. SJP92]KXX70793.1 hypothetical protein AVL50_07080 [Flammeovirga sp. SJP92]
MKKLQLQIICLFFFILFISIISYFNTEFNRSFRKITYYDDLEEVVKKMNHSKGINFVITENDDSLFVLLDQGLLTVGDSIIKKTNSSKFIVKNDSSSKSYQLRYIGFNDWVHSILGKREIVSDRGEVSYN